MNTSSFTIKFRQNSVTLNIPGLFMMNNSSFKIYQRIMNDKKVSIKNHGGHAKIPG
jgi:hypothetical protein